MEETEDVCGICRTPGLTLIEFMENPNEKKATAGLCMSCMALNLAKEDKHKMHCLHCDSDCGIGTISDVSGEKAIVYVCPECGWKYAVYPKKISRRG